MQNDAVLPLFGQCEAGISSQASAAAGLFASVFSGKMPDAREAPRLGEEFVIHSLRHTMLTRLGESGADVFTIMRIAGHASVTTSQRYADSIPESMERAFERNAAKFEAEKQEVANGSVIATISTTAKQRRFNKSTQIIEITTTGP